MDPGDRVQMRDHGVLTSTSLVAGEHLRLRRTRGGLRKWWWGTEKGRQRGHAMCCAALVFSLLCHMLRASGVGWFTWVWAHRPPRVTGAGKDGLNSTCTNEPVWNFTSRTHIGASSEHQLVIGIVAMASVNAAVDWVSVVGPGAHVIRGPRIQGFCQRRPMQGSSKGNQCANLHAGRGKATDLWAARMHRGRPLLVRAFMSSRKNAGGVPLGSIWFASVWCARA
jgi:hypothetical protein